MTDTEIESRLRGVETNLASLATLVQSNLSSLAELTKKHETILNGNPDDPKDASVGLKIKVDRLENAEGIRRKVLGMFASMVFMLLGAGISHLLF